MNQALRWVGAVLITALPVLLTGCGGGGDKPLFTADHVPLASGDRRLWQHTAGPQQGLYSAEAVGATVQVAGVAALAVRDLSGQLSYRAASGAGVQALPGPDADALTTALGPVEVLRFGLGVGDSVALLDKAVVADVDGDGLADAVRVRADFSVLGFGPVNTPAGRFDRAAHVRAAVATTVAPGRGGAGTTVLHTVEDWYVVGLGRVRSVSTTQAAGQPASSQTLELAAYSVGSRRSDGVLPRLLAINPADGAVVSSAASIQLRFSEPVDAWGLVGDQGPRLLDAQGQPVPTRMALSADGNQVTLTPAAALAEGAYTVRSGAAVVDWANNVAAGAQARFVVDGTRPQLASAVPAADSTSFSGTGPVSMTFSEDLSTPDASGLAIEILDAVGGVWQRLPASLSARTLSAQVGTALPLNTAFAMRAAGTLVDAAGNSLVSGTVAFRTDPGPFARPLALVPGTAVGSVQLADLDGDGRPDLVYTGISLDNGMPYLGVRYAQPAGGFAPPWPLNGLGTALACSAQSLTVADFDGDGRADVAVSCDGVLQVHRQTTPGGFQMALPGFTASLALTALPWSSDGRSDLLFFGTRLASSLNRPSWYVITRHPSGGWEALIIMDPGLVPAQGEFGNLDNQQCNEMVWLDEPPDLSHALGFSVCKTRGFGFASGYRPHDFALRLLPTDHFTALAIGQLVGDARPDVIVAGTYGGQGRLALLLGQDFANGTFFGATQWLDSAPEPTAVAVADVNGDGRVDLIAYHPQPGRLGIYLQKPAGGHEAERLFEASPGRSYTGRSVLVVDVDGDGRLDLVALTDVLLGRAWPEPWPAGLPAKARPGLTAPAVATTPVPRAWRR